MKTKPIGKAPFLKEKYCQWGRIKMWQRGQAAALITCIFNPYLVLLLLVILVYFAIMYLVVANVTSILSADGRGLMCRSWQTFPRLLVWWRSLLTVWNEADTQRVISQIPVIQLTQESPSPKTAEFWKDAWHFPDISQRPLWGLWLGSLLNSCLCLSKCI